MLSIFLLSSILEPKKLWIWEKLLSFALRTHENFLTSFSPFSIIYLIVTYWQHIIFSGADANLQDKNGNTPLHLCAKSGYVECCRKLTPSGVNVNCVNFEKRTCLHLSAFKGSVECLDFLIASGANINVVDKHKRLPLHYVASRSWFNCTFTLIDSGNHSSIKSFWIPRFSSLISCFWYGYKLCSIYSWVTILNSFHSERTLA